MKPSTHVGRLIDRINKSNAKAANALAGMKRSLEYAQGGGDGTLDIMELCARDFVRAVRATVRSNADLARFRALVEFENDAREEKRLATNPILPGTIPALGAAGGK